MIAAKIEDLYLPALKALADDNGCDCHFDSMGNLVFTRYQCTWAIDGLLFLYACGNWGLIEDKVKTIVKYLALALRDFDWPVKPEWQKRKEILYRKFNGA